MVGGLAFAASKLDEEFDAFIAPAMMKNSNNDGLGYEEEIKSTAGGIYGAPTGTKKTRGGKKGGKKGGFSFPFGKK